ncbi:MULTISPECIES: hypothetical protein [unclassified Curtobacterium]|uniref:hypothetical protein n=1 Tax=unclassified Curtobacterium TaxID=257496 RepID=UPI001587915F|nr:MULTISPECIES: hypothetical protein [unclassified Curtobacterium]
MRFVNWFFGVLAAVGRGQDAGNGVGPGVPADTASRLADDERNHRRRNDHRP